jgi:uncharacterized protein (TIGR01244 family)
MKGNAPPAVVIAAACMFLVVPREAPAQAASESPATGQSVPMAASPAISAWHHPREGLLTGGQPAPADWAELKAQGVTTIINLRPSAEMAGRNEAAEVGATGMAYIELPVAGAEDIDADNARRLWSLLKASPAPVFVHCASGNRVGALLALGAAQSGGMDADAALEFGRSAGLRGLEPVVRERLGLPPAD